MFPQGAPKAQLLTDKACLPWVWEAPEIQKDCRNIFTVKVRSLLQDESCEFSGESQEWGNDSKLLDALIVLDGGGGTSVSHSESGEIDGPHEWGQWKLSQRRLGKSTRALG